MLLPVLRSLIVSGLFVCCFRRKLCSLNMVVSVETQRYFSPPSVVAFCLQPDRNSPELHFARQWHAAVTVQTI